MSSTRTITAGFARHRTPQGGRTSHLLPEIHARSKRILASAQTEMIAANSSVVRRMAEIWKAKMSGAACTCTNEAAEAVKQEEARDSVIDLKEFLITGELKQGSVKESCPICYGTGFVGGYTLHGTQELVLEANNVTTLKNASKERKKPWWIKASKASIVTWNVRLPAYFSGVYACFLKWNVMPRSWSLQVNNEAVTEGSLMKYAGEDVVFTLRMSDNAEENAGLFSISLFFVIGDCSINVDIPNYTKSFTGDLRVWNEINGSVTANFDSRVNLTTLDLFALEDGPIYRIIQVEENNPLGVVISWNCEARLVREFEHYYTIPSKWALKAYAIPNITFLI